MSPMFLAESVRLALSSLSRTMHLPPPGIASRQGVAESSAISQGKIAPRAASRGGARWSAQITPLDSTSSSDQRRPVEVTSIDERGVAFLHEAPLAARRVLLTPDDPASGIPEAVLDLTWCRFSPGGAYSSGGRYERAYKRPA